MKYSIIAVIALTGCSASALGTGGDVYYDTGGWAESDSYDGDFGDDREDPPVSEEEESFLTLLPAQTDRFIFIANPDRDTVTRVNVETQDVDTVEVGKTPRHVETTSDYSRAIIYNRGSSSVTVLDAHTLEQDEIPVRPNLTRMRVDPTAQWAILWHDPNAIEPGDPIPQGITSTHEVSLVNLNASSHSAHVVFFTPKDIAFSADGSRAVLTSDDLVAIFDLNDANPTPRIVPIEDDPLAAPSAEEIALNNTGDIALIRQLGANEIKVLDLNTELVDSVPVGQNPTDIDLLPNNRAAVVSRDSHELHILDMDDPLAVPIALQMPGSEPLGSLIVDPTGQQGIVYTNASANDRYISWDLATDDMVLRPLVKPVKAVTVSPTGDSLIVFHTKSNTVETPPEFEDRWALSLIDMDSHLATAWQLPSEPTGFVNAGDGRRSYFIMDNQPWLEIIDFESRLYEEMPLLSNPTHVGVLPYDVSGGLPTAWVSQAHRLGRLSFYNPNTDELQTVTGFELNSQIEE